MTVLEKTDADIGTAGLLLRLKPGRLDERAIRSLVGDVIAKTHAAVGREFGLSANTIKQSWAPQGMPGEQGNYPIAEILIWRLDYEAKVDRGRSQYADLADQQLDRKQREAEARKLELQADRLEREEQEAMGNLIPRGDVVRTLRALASTFAERMNMIPDKIAPTLPTELVTEVTEQIRTEIQRHLKAFSELSSRDVLGGEQ